MSNGDANNVFPEPSRPQRRVVMCFDGTTNKFHGSEEDTNIVKLYRMMNRKSPNQFHYYQPGIGTYNHGGSLSSAATFAGSFKDTIESGIDSAIATSFKDHVLAGYKFLMRHYYEGDQLYIFGFSRGAYTARFLSEMIHELGLLSRGNEEMVPFAWEAFSAYQRSDRDERPNPRLEFMRKFTQTFCRSGVTIYFLGLFDCVNSVGQFEIPFWQITSSHTASAPPATHIRHAVSIHERRVKFKPELFNVDSYSINAKNKTLKEVWFAGDHCDIGGGWKRDPGETCLLSDHPLHWMVKEVKSLPDYKLEMLDKDPYDKNTQHKDWYRPTDAMGWIIWGLNLVSTPRLRRPETPHDSLVIGAGPPVYETLFWWILEILPIFARLELENGKWVTRRYPNLGRMRDIPVDAKMDESVGEYVKRNKIPDPHMTSPGSGFLHLLSWSNIRERLALPKRLPSSPPNLVQNGLDGA